MNAEEVATRGSDVAGVQQQVCIDSAILSRSDVSFNASISDARKSGAGVVAQECHAAGRKVRTEFMILAKRVG